MARPGRESRQEVGARRRAEAAWQVAEDHLRLLVEDATDEAIFTTDPVDLLRPGLA